MPGRRVLLICDDVPFEPVLQAALGPAVLDLLDSGPADADYLRVYRPTPTVGFTGRDCASPGIGRAVQKAAAHGFAAVRRGPGGRAAAYHRGALCIDHIGRVDGFGLGIAERFARFADLLAHGLRELGVPAGVGAVPGEFCPGDHSVHDGAGHKLVGTAQRLTRTGALFSMVVLVADPEPLRAVLIDVYAALGLEFDPRTVGAISDTRPDLDMAEATRSIVASLTEGAAVQRIPLPAQAVDRARALRARHIAPDPLR